MYADKQCINGIKIAKNCVKSLSIYLGHDKIQCYEKKKWLSKLEKRTIFYANINMYAEKLSQSIHTKI